MNKKQNPKKTQFNVRVTPVELEALRRHAYDEDISISMLVRRELVSLGLLSSPTAELKA